MKSRNKVIIQFIIDEVFVFRASCIATVKIDSESNEIIDSEYCADIEDLEDVELVEILSEEYLEDSIPLEEEIKEEDIQEVINIDLI